MTKRILRMVLTAISVTLLAGIAMARMIIRCAKSIR